jgi:hypothetical protein
MDEETCKPNVFSHNLFTHNHATTAVVKHIISLEKLSANSGHLRAKQNMGTMFHANNSQRALFTEIF